MGLFLLARVTTVLLLRDARAAQWTSMFLDEWGEEDLNIKRGKPLHLNKEVSFLPHSFLLFLLKNRYGRS